MKGELNLFGYSGFQKPQKISFTEHDNKIADKTSENKKDLTLESQKDEQQDQQESHVKIF